jgi:hypothetical protein
MHLPLYEVDIADKQTYKECTNSVASSEYKLTVKNLYWQNPLASQYNVTYKLSNSINNNN